MFTSSYSSGISLCLLIALAALLLAPSVPIGSVTLAIVLGIIIGNAFQLPTFVKPGIAFCEKRLLALAIVFMGARLDLTILEALGGKALLLVVSALAVTLFTSVILSKILKLDLTLCLLLGIGNGVCGSSAIAATEEIIGAKEEDVGLSIAVVNFLGTLGIVLLPAITEIVLHLPELLSGMLVGNTLQAVGQVVASGFSISEVAGQTATIMKMTRIVMLLPLVFILIAIFSGERGGTTGETNRPAIPLFIIGFVFFSLVATFHLIPEEAIALIEKTSHYLLVIAMSAIGLNITLKSILQEGSTSLLVGALIFLVQIVFSSTMIVLFW